MGESLEPRGKRLSLRVIQVFDVLLTTYEMVRNDRKQFADARIIRFAGS